MDKHKSKNQPQIYHPKIYEGDNTTKLKGLHAIYPKINNLDNI